MVIRYYQHTVFRKRIELGFYATRQHCLINIFSGVLGYLQLPSPLSSRVSSSHLPGVLGSPAPMSLEFLGLQLPCPWSSWVSSSHVPGVLGSPAPTPLGQSVKPWRSVPLESLRLKSMRMMHVMLHKGYVNTYFE